ncbi:MAG: hypothetical protein H6648_08690 [Caldilineae bacterium]|nr:hypothetical protein [Caldilineae bacterium]
MTQTTGMRVLVVPLLLAALSINLACTADLGLAPEVDETALTTGNGGTGVLITGTLQIRENGELADRERVSVSQIGNVVVSHHIGLDGAGYVPWMRSYSRQGNLSFYLRRDASGEATSLSGSVIDTQIPEIISSSIGTASAPGDPRLHALIDYFEQPVADLAVVDQLVVEGLIAETAPTSHLGLAVRTFDIELDDVAYYPTAFARIWLSSAEGFKLRLERWLELPGGDPDIIFTSHSIDTSIALGEGYFTPEYMEPSLHQGIITDFVRAEAFDPISGTLPAVPEVVSILYPNSLPVSNTFALDSSAFITGTLDSRLMESYVRSWEGPVGVGKWWVTQEYLDGAEAVLVIQGPDTQLDAPVDLGELWPPSWEGADPTVLLEHIYAAASAGNFADGSPYDRYGLADPALAPDRVWVPPYEHLVTWLEPGGIRVVVLSQGLTAEGVVAFSERYREVAQ